MIMDRIDRLVSKMKPQERLLHEWQFALSRRLQQIMEERNLTQREFAKIARLTEPQVSAIVHLDANPTIGVLARIAALLDAELLEWTNTDVNRLSNADEIEVLPRAKVYKLESLPMNMMEYDSVIDFKGYPHMQSGT
jgi:transcriptional regulator with XRE-family HTH domain